MSSQRPSLIRARRPLNAILRTRLAAALAAPHGVDDFLELIDPAWSVRHVRARVVGVHGEGGDAVSLWFSPNDNWRGFCAGQFVTMSVWIGGVRYTRCFSLSSAPEDGVPLRLTIKALSGGRVSAWAMREARRGDVVELSQPMGQFVLPEPVLARLLFISGGSGITPILSMVRHLVASGHTGEIVCLHYARRAVILGEELADLARRHPRFRLAIQLTQPSACTGAPSSHFSREQLASLVPDWQEWETFVCGPGPLLEAVASLWRERGIVQRLHVERFNAASPSIAIARRNADAQHRLVFARSKREARGHERATLLEQAEDAGLAPAYGCRIGVCHRCECIKRSGIVRNELTGIIDDQAGKTIQLCISTPCSDVELDL